jgi:hypothetical protein
MELNDLLLLLACNTLISGLLTLIFALVMSYFRDLSLTRRMTILEQEMDEFVQVQSGRLGASVKAEKKERTQMAMAEAMVLFQSGKPKEEIFKELLAKYPDVAMDLAAKGIKL